MQDVYQNQKPVAFCFLRQILLRYLYAATLLIVR